MITSMHIENFKCFKDFDIELGPFNVLIGPNDSGKTAFLQAIRLAGSVQRNQQMPAGRIRELLGTNSVSELAWKGTVSAPIVMRIFAPPLNGVNGNWCLRFLARGSLHFNSCFAGAPGNDVPEGSKVESSWRHHLLAALGTVAFYRFNPADLRKPSMLSQEMTLTGDGFPTFLDHINRTDRSVFMSLEREFYDRFPHYRLLQMPSAKDVTNALALSFRTIHGEDLPASLVSDGVMLSLAYLA